MLTALDLPLEVWETIVNQTALDMPSVRRFSTVSSACRAIAHQRRLTVTFGCGIFTEGDEGDEAAAVRQSEALETMHDNGAWPLVRVAPEVLCRVALALSECGPPRHVEAARWYREAAEQGDPEAQFNLGYSYVNGEGVEEDKAEAVRWWRRAAEQGDGDAQYNLGLAYANGEGVEEDKAEAVRWWRRAAEQGDAGAQFTLGLAYANGEGVEEGKAEAARWFKKAAEQGHPDSQCCLGQLLFTGADGVAKDAVRAGEWLRKAAEQGHGPGSNWLGVWLLATADGADTAEARRLFRAAIDADAPDDDEDEFVGFEARARRNLGLALEGGVGGDVDLAGALALYREAAAGEHPNAVACYSLWLLASKGTDGTDGTMAADTEPFQRLQGLGVEERAALVRAAIEEHNLLSGSQLASLWASRGLGASRVLGHDG